MYSYSTGEEINIVDVCVFGVSDVTSYVRSAAAAISPPIERARTADIVSA